MSFYVIDNNIRRELIKKKNVVDVSANIFIPTVDVIKLVKKITQ